MERYSFFNSVNGDRKYKADDWALYFSKFITNGVFPNIASNLQVISDGTNMTVKLKAGAAWINGYMYENTADLNLNIDVADGVLNRIDRIVIQLSYADRLIKAVVKKGAFASSPVAPSLQRDADIYELGIADIAVNKGITTITQSMITDLRLNTSLCGMVNSLLQADTTAIFNQYQDWFNQKSVDYENEFESWFDTVKGQLSGDVAGNLQNQITTNTNSINNLAGTGRTTETVKGNADTLAIHQADEVKHITATERTTWNGKLDSTQKSAANGVAGLDTNKRIQQESVPYQVYKTNKDANGIYTTVDYKRLDGTLWKNSVLSNLSGSNYLTQTIKYYDTNGATLLATEVWTITYDADGNIVSEVKP